MRSITDEEALVAAPSKGAAPTLTVTPGPDPTTPAEPPPPEQPPPEPPPPEPVEPVEPPERGRATEPVTSDPPAPDPLVPVSPGAEPPDVPKDPDSPGKDRGGRAPRWARLLLVVGVVLMVLSGSVVVGTRLAIQWATSGITQEVMLPPELLPEAKTIEGPVNILLLGMDERSSNTEPIRTDSIILVHIPASHDTVYMISLPRDTQVEIPAFPASDYPGGVGKLTEAFERGNTRAGQGDPSPAGRARGVQLTARTINRLVPGGIKLNAVAIIDYVGFRSLVGALGGVDMCIDERTVSDHYDTAGNYVGDTFDKGIPGYVYEKGCRHLAPWQALDFVRQRKSLPDGDYGRQRHQQQFLYAVFSQVLSKGTLTDVTKFGALRKAAGNLLTLDLGGVSITDWIFTFKHLRANDMQLIKTNAGKFNGAKINGIDYEFLTQETKDLLRALHDDRIAEFLAQHSDFLAKPK